MGFGFSYSAPLTRQFEWLSFEQMICLHLQSVSIPIGSPLQALHLSKGLTLDIGQFKQSLIVFGAELRCGAQATCCAEPVGDLRSVEVNPSSGPASYREWLA